MTSITRIGAVATAASLCIAVPAAADTIRISSGALIFTTPPLGPISVELAGEGFTFSGSTVPFSIWFSPYESCTVPACVAGSTLDLRTAGAASTYRSATVTYQGVTYNNLTGINNTSDIYTEWTGSVVFPQGFTGGTLTAPFAFSGTFRPSDTYIDLSGSGTATLTFGPYNPLVNPHAFATQTVRFDFADVAPTPEPASMLLVATGLAALAARRRRRRIADGEPTV